MAAGGRKHQDLSAKDFKGPLLAVLGDLSNLTPDEPIKFKDTWAPICNSMGITIEQYGTQDDGKDWVQTWIGWAFRHLKSDGLGASKGRGKWSLTQAGVDKAKAQAYEAKTPMADTIASDLLVELPEVPELPELPPGVGVSLNIGGGNNESGYHHDPYIRALAVSKTKCYGGYSSRSAVCGACPLSGACQNFVAASLSALAATLAVEDVTPKTETQFETVAGPPDETSKAGTASSDGWDNTGAESLVSHVAAVCYRCTGTIKPGSKAFWIPSEAAPSGGLFHVECWGSGSPPEGT